MANSSRKKILVAVDGSNQALEAVRYVSRILPSEQMDVVLYHVMTKIPESFWDLEKEPAFQSKIINIKAWETQQEKMIEDFMDKAERILLEAGIPREMVRVNIHERREGIARDIVTESTRGYAAVVVGRTGLSELKDLVLGSIANKLMEKLTHVPIWVIGDSPQAGKLLVSLDTSEGAMQAVNYVGSMLDGSDFHVTLFHAIRGFNIFQRMQGKSFVPEHRKDWLESAEKELEEAGRAIEPVFLEAKVRLQQAGLKADHVDTKVVTGVSSRAGSIVEEAEKQGYGTIVVGRRGLSRVQEFFMGRVSNKVIQLARKNAVWVVS